MTTAYAVSATANWPGSYGVAASSFYRGAAWNCNVPTLTYVHTWSRNGNGCPGDYVYTAGNCLVDPAVTFNVPIQSFSCYGSTTVNAVVTVNGGTTTIRDLPATTVNGATVTETSTSFVTAMVTRTVVSTAPTATLTTTVTVGGQSVKKRKQELLSEICSGSSEEEANKHQSGQLIDPSILGNNTCPVHDIPLFSRLFKRALITCIGGTNHYCDSTAWCVGFSGCCPTPNGCASVDLYAPFALIPPGIVGLALFSATTYTRSSVITAQATVHAPSTTVGASRTVTVPTTLTTTRENTITSIDAAKTIWVTVTTTIIGGGRTSSNPRPEGGSSTVQQIEVVTDAATVVLTSSTVITSDGVVATLINTYSVTTATTRTTTRDVVNAQPLYTGAPLLTGSCASATWTVLPFANGDLFELPLVGCGRDRPGCCPSGGGNRARAIQTDPVIASIARNTLAKCPQDYQTISNTLCCPSGYSLHTAALDTRVAAQTPCVKALATPLSQPSDVASSLDIIAASITSDAAGSFRTITVNGNSQFALSLPVQEKASGLSTGAKAGIGAGAAVGGLALIGLVGGLFYMRRKKNNNTAEEAAPEIMAVEKPPLSPTVTSLTSGENSNADWNKYSSGLSGTTQQTQRDSYAFPNPDQQGFTYISEHPQPTNIPYPPPPQYMHRSTASELSNEGSHPGSRSQSPISNPHASRELPAHYAIPEMVASEQYPHEMPSPTSPQVSRRTVGQSD